MPPEQIESGSALVCGADHLHLARVLRIRTGDRVVLLDNLGGAFLGSVETIEKSRTLIGIIGPAETKPEPHTKITVAQALGKADKFEQVVQHGTEAGASSFVPVRSDHCVVDVRKESDRAAAQQARWKQIAKGAAQQCGRTFIPTVLEPVLSAKLFHDTCSNDPIETIRLILHTEADSTPLRSTMESLTSRPKSVYIAVGPEGGWSPSELSAAQSAGWRQISLGPYVLRMETAALVAISQILFCFGV